MEHQAGCLVLWLTALLLGELRRPPPVQSFARPPHAQTAHPAVPPPPPLRPHAPHAPPPLTSPPRPPSRLCQWVSTGQPLTTPPARAATQRPATRGAGTAAWHTSPASGPRCTRSPCSAPGSWASPWDPTQGAATQQQPAAAQLPRTRSGRPRRRCWARGRCCRRAALGKLPATRGRSPPCPSASGWSTRASTRCRRRSGPSWWKRSTSRWGCCTSTCGWVGGRAGGWGRGVSGALLPPGRLMAAAGMPSWWHGTTLTLHAQALWPATRAWPPCGSQVKRPPSGRLLVPATCIQWDSAGFCNK